jgi:hypothetical protein
VAVSSDLVYPLWLVAADRGLHRCQFLMRKSWLLWWYRPLR